MTWQHKDQTKNSLISDKSSTAEKYKVDHIDYVFANWNMTEQYLPMKTKIWWWEYRNSIDTAKVYNNIMRHTAIKHLLATKKHIKWYNNPSSVVIFSQLNITTT